MLQVIIGFDTNMTYTDQIECKEKYKIPGDHFTVVQRPNVELLASGINKWILENKIQVPGLNSIDNKVANLHGKVAIVTGANSGIGREVTRMLVASGARVIMACRNLSLAQQAALEIRAKVSDAKLDIIQLELDSFQSLRNFEDIFKKLQLPLHILVHCAGVYATEKRKTNDGFELQLQVHQISPFILNKLLLPYLQKR